MAKRYVRTVRFERCDEHEIDLRINQLAYQLAELTENRFPRSEGWDHEETEDAVFEWEVRRDAFTGRVFADQEVDVEDRPDGKGRIRRFSIRVSAFADDPGETRPPQLSRLQLAVLFGIFGGAVLTAATAVVEALVTGIIHLPLLLLVLVAGLGFCAGIGLLFGKAMRNLLFGRSLRAWLRTAEARPAWGRFVEELADVVDEFADEVEESSSTAAT